MPSLRFNHMELTVPKGALAKNRDDRVEIKEYDDLEIGDTVVRAFYVRYLLPIWFDVQVIESASGALPAKRWVYGSD